MSKVEADIRMVPIGDLRQSPDNPRRITDRDFARLRKSIRDDPDFMRLRPVLARPDGTVYAGNMRLEAARAEGWTDVPAIITDDPEAVIRARAVKDNASYGEWVEEDLAEYLSGLAAMDVNLDLDTLGLDAQVSEAVGISVDMHALDDMSATLPSDSPPTSVGGHEQVDTASPEPAASSPVDARTEVGLTAQASYAFDPDAAEPTYDLPRYRDDRLVDALPADLQTWCGKETPDDGGVFLYNYSPAGTWREVPLDRCILSFFTEDRFLFRWLLNPAYFVARALASGIKMFVEPDATPIVYPKALGIHNLYLGRYLTRFMQDQGMLAIPRIVYPAWPDPDGTNWVSEVGFPAYAPVMALNGQSHNDDARDPYKDDRQQKYERLGAGLTRFFGDDGGHRCDTLLVYGRSGWEGISAHTDLPPDIEVVVMPTYLDRRRELGLPWRAN